MLTVAPDLVALALAGALLADVEPPADVEALQLFK